MTSSSKHSEDLRPCGNFNSRDADSSNGQTDRLNKLENEVYRLRNDVDKIKWQRAAAETAIERAISRGATALGGRYKIAMPYPAKPLNNDKINVDEKFANTDGASNESVASNDSRLMNKNSRNILACEAAAADAAAASTIGTTSNNVKEKKANAAGCGRYTLG